MIQYTFSIPDNIQAKELLNFILKTKIFKVDNVNEISNSNVNIEFISDEEQKEIVEELQNPEAKEVVHSETIEL